MLALALLSAPVTGAERRRKRRSAPTAQCEDTAGKVVSKAYGAAKLTEVGNKYFGQQNHAAARACYEWALHKDKDFSTAVLNLGLIHHVQGDFAAAERVIRRAAQLAPDYGYARMSLGDLFASRTPPSFEKVSFTTRAPHLFFLWHGSLRGHAVWCAYGYAYAGAEGGGGEGVVAHFAGNRGVRTRSAARTDAGQSAQKPGRGAPTPHAGPRDRRPPCRSHRGGAGRAC